MSFRSRLYRGEVMHRRLRPFAHGFRYRVFALVVDIDELPALGRALRLFSYNRANLFSFDDRDHGPRDGSALRPWVEAHLAAAGLMLPGGRIELLCFPRLLGYVFNPLSVYYCHDAAGALRAVLYEVKNTFGQQHGYLIPADAPGADGWVRQSGAKRFHVSPFLPMDCSYRFRVQPPAERLGVVIRQAVAGAETLVATLTGRRRTLSDGTLAAAALAIPLMTFKVIAAIHWQALRLWLKGARFHRSPDPPEGDVTYQERPQTGAQAP